MQSDNVERARQYLAAIEQGVVGDQLAAFFTPDLVQEEFPNRLIALGARRDLAAVIEAAQRGQGAVSAQHYDIQHVVANGDMVALEVIWTATLRVPIGSIPVGGEMRAHFAVFLQFREGNIAAQRNYDCFDPW